jgi:uncharacterized PurR-regulated membrane protein YhhQ (DUF165 family)
MIYSYLAMIYIVALSNYLVQFPINDWLTWGAFPYPISYFITEITTRNHGPQSAKKVIYIGFFTAVLLSFQIVSPKIALASAAAFFLSQIADMLLFYHIRKATWWRAPLFASLFASILDTAVFWLIAFWGEQVPVLSWACGDFLVKLTLDILLLIPFRLYLFRAVAQE